MTIKDAFNQTGRYSILVTVYKLPKLSKPVKKVIRVPIMGEHRYEVPIIDKFNVSVIEDVRPEFAKFEDFIYTFRPTSQ